MECAVVPYFLWCVKKTMQALEWRPYARGQALQLLLLRLRAVVVGAVVRTAAAQPAVPGQWSGAPSAIPLRA